MFVTTIPKYVGFCAGRSGQHARLPGLFGRPDEEPGAAYVAITSPSDKVTSLIFLLEVFVVVESAVAVYNRPRT